MALREYAIEGVLWFADWAMLKLTRGKIGVTEQVRLRDDPVNFSNQALADYIASLPVDHGYHHDTSMVPVLKRAP